MRELMFSVRIPDKMLASFSLMVNYMQRLHNNYYIHS